MAQRLGWFGKLTLYTRQLDMVLKDWHIKDFMREHNEGKGL